MGERAFPGTRHTGALLACVALLATVVSAGDAGSVPTSSVVAPSDTLLATVYRVDAEAGTVEVLTGVGFALRVARVHTVPETEVYVGGEGATLGALARGQVVRIAFREKVGEHPEYAEGRVARTIHAGMPEEPGKEP